MLPLVNVGVREIRLEMGLSQSQLAALVGISSRAIQSYEQGWRQPSRLVGAHAAVAADGASSRRRVVPVPLLGAEGVLAQCAREVHRLCDPPRASLLVSDGDDVRRAAAGIMGRQAACVRGLSLHAGASETGYGQDSYPRRSPLIIPQPVLVPRHGPSSEERRDSQETRPLGFPWTEMKTSSVRPPTGVITLRVSHPTLPA